MFWVKKCFGLKKFLRWVKKFLRWEKKFWVKKFLWIILSAGWNTLRLTITAPLVFTTDHRLYLVVTTAKPKLKIVKNFISKIIYFRGYNKGDHDLWRCKNNRQMDITFIGDKRGAGLKQSHPDLEYLGLIKKLFSERIRNASFPNA